MCGIVSVWRKNGSILPNTLYKSLEKLTHRGPDKKNVWLSSKYKVGLGHSRLSIIGVGNGLQPLTNSEHKIHAVVNGEFYDYLSIRSDYEKKGYRFLTDSDSEIIIPLYIEYGAKLFEKLNGEFAFIIWDEKNQMLFAARDRFGIKPLYYSETSDFFAAASEIKALVPLGVTLNWDEGGLGSIFSGIPLQGKSCFKNIKQIKPGHFIVLNQTGLIEKSYWDFKYEIKGNEGFQDSDFVKIFKEKLKNAIKRRLVADVSVGFYLSGGIDSSAILSLASEITTDLRAFNISFEDAKNDEFVYANEIASKLGIKLSSIQVSSQDIADNFEETIYHREAPVFQTNGVAKFLLSKYASKSGYKVVLTGEGADELLAGYPPFKEDLFHSLNAEQKRMLGEEIDRQSAEFMFDENFITPQMKVVQKKLKYMPAIWKLSFHIAEKMQGIYSDEFGNFSKSYDPVQTLLESSSVLEKTKDHPVNSSLYIFAKTFFPELVLSYLGDRVEMAHSIEGRLPFLDIELVTFCNQLPIDLKIRNLKEKYILYESVKDYIPHTIYTRNKHAITTPLVGDKVKTEKKSPMYVVMNDIFHSRGFRELQFFDQDKTIHLLNSIEAMGSLDKMSAEYALNFALSTYFLGKRFMNG